MNDNKFQLRRLAKWREESMALFKSVGMRPAQYEDALVELADAGTQKVIARASQFLFDFSECGATALLERAENKCLRTIYNDRTAALDIICKNATG